MHKHCGDLNKKKNHGEECACIVPPIPVSSPVEAETCYGNGERRANGRGYYKDGGVQPQTER